MVHEFHTFQRDAYARQRFLVVPAQTEQFALQFFQSYAVLDLLHLLEQLAGDGRTANQAVAGLTAYLGLICVDFELGGGKLVGRDGKG